MAKKPQKRHKGKKIFSLDMHFKQKKWNVSQGKRCYGYHQSFFTLEGRVAGDNSL